jgi:TonB family protein
MCRIDVPSGSKEPNHFPLPPLRAADVRPLNLFMKRPFRIWRAVLSIGFVFAVFPINKMWAKPPKEPELSELKVDGKFDENPKLIFRPVIECPPSVVEKKISGEVEVDFHVAAEGCVDAAKVKAAPDPYAGSCVMSALARMVFSPAKREGKPVDFVVHARVKFVPGKY